MTARLNAADEPLPIGTGLTLDADTVVHSDGSVFGGSPGRLFKLNPAAQRVLRELQDGTVRTAAGAALARRLTDAGLFHPRPTAGSAALLTVLVPVRDRVIELNRCLSALRIGDQVVELIVIDDGSADPSAVAAVGRRHGARVIRREVNGGPGAAGNTGLAAVTTEFVACCDSDCAPPPNWASLLVGHFADPLVAAVAPRVVAEPPRDRSVAARYASARSPLDLGDRPARVQPMTRVSYVPTAAIVLRMSAISAVGMFDEQLRYGEDVDLVWRLIEAGWRVRYDPSVTVPHAEPTRWRAILSRRAAYGTSAARLEERHPGQAAPLILVASPGVTVAALVAGKPLLALAAASAGYAEIATALRRAGRGDREVARPLARGLRETWFGSGRWLAQFAGPVVLALVVRRRRLALLALLLSPPLREWWRRRPDIDPVRWTAAVLADDAAYGAGVWLGSARRRHLAAVLPQFRLRLISRPARRQS